MTGEAIRRKIVSNLTSSSRDTSATSFRLDLNLLLIVLSFQSSVFLIDKEMRDGRILRRNHLMERVGFLSSCKRTTVDPLLIMPHCKNTNHAKLYNNTITTEYQERNYLNSTHHTISLISSSHCIVQQSNQTDTKTSGAVTLTRSIIVEQYTYEQVMTSVSLSVFLKFGWWEQPNSTIY